MTESMENIPKKIILKNPLVATTVRLETFPIILLTDIMKIYIMISKLLWISHFVLAPLSKKEETYMDNENDYDKLVVKWTKRIVEHLYDHRDALAFLLPRISLEPWLVREYGCAIRSSVRELKIDGQPCDIFFEVGGKSFNKQGKRVSFDLLIWPREPKPEDKKVISEIKEKAIVIEFKPGTLDRKRKGKKYKEILGSSALVEGICQDKKKLNENEIKNAYVIGFLYTCNRFLQTRNQSWRPLCKEKGESFDGLRNNIIKEISSNDGINLLNNEEKLFLTFSNGDLSGKACFLIYKTKQ